MASHAASLGRVGCRGWHRWHAGGESVGMLGPLISFFAMASIWVELKALVSCGFIRFVLITTYPAL